MKQTIPIQFYTEPVALKRRDAARALGVSERTFDRLTAEGRIPRTSYGVYPVEALIQHVRREAGL